MKAETGFLFEIRDGKNPLRGSYIAIPKEKVDLIRGRDVDYCCSLMKALVADYEAVDAEKGIYYMILEGHKFYMNFFDEQQALREIDIDYTLHGEYEPYTTKLINDVVKEGNICLDVGASVGYMTLLMARKVGKTGKVYSFEPTINQYNERLLRNIEANGYKDVVCAYNLGAWDEALTDAKLQTNKGLIDPMVTVRLDDIIPEWLPIDFVKIDTDGSEPHVLKGMEEIVQRSPNLKMVIEYYPKYIENLGGNPQDVLDFLNKYFTYEEIKGDYGDGYWNYYCKRK